MAHGEECDDPECGCAAHRVGRLRRRWRHFVHRVVHPVSGTIVLLGAAWEVFEWLGHGAELLIHALEGGH